MANLLGLSADDCVLFMWATSPCLKQAFEVIDSWGFTYKTVGLYWAKLNKSAKRNQIDADKSFFMGMGYYGRANPELALLGASEEFEMDLALLGTSNKAPERKDAGVRKLIIDNIREHSRKPDSTHEKLERLFGDIPRLEMFAREERIGWDCFGNEVEKFNDK
jgi:N6-adenosine-specific RNA methylase IME4